MANPKKRHSNARTRARRTHYKVTPLATCLCPECNQPRLPHRVCPSCGSYKGRQIIQVKTG